MLAPKHEKRSKQASLNLSKIAKNRKSQMTILRKRPSLLQLLAPKHEKCSKQTNLHLSKTA